MISARQIRKTALCVVILGGVYTLACTYLWARQGHFIFTPRREIKKTPASVHLPYMVSYRGYGMSDGEFPSERNLYADAEAAWNYLVLNKKIRPDNIYIYGHSIGGAVAIDLAVRHPHAAGLIVEATFTSIMDVARLNHKYRIFPSDPTGTSLGYKRMQHAITG
jgi:pimeloyl-ACP methyl ester carboxylesterase